MAPVKREIPLRAAAVIAALALAASIVSGRDRDDAPAPEARAARMPPAEPLEQMDINQFKIARALETLPDLPAPLAGFTPTPAAPGDSPEVLGPEPPAGEPARPMTRRGAPPLPFIYLGQILDDGKTTVFVARGEDHYSLAPGLVIDDTYKVERVTDTQVTF